MATPNEQAWVRIQRKTFTRWCNNFLQQRNLEIGEMERDLQDGLLLHNLLEILANEDIAPKPRKNAKMKLQKVENLNSCLRYIKSKDIKLVGIGAEDIHDGKTSLVLGLIWTLILRFQIETYEEEDEEGRSARQALLDWCNKVLNPQGIIVANFKDSWQDGRAFCGLVDALEPNAIPLDQCPSNNADANLNRAFDTAERLFAFPKVLDAIDVIENPDDLSIMTYVSYFRAFLAANTAFAPNCYAEGPGLVEATSGKPGEYTVFAVNEEGQKAQRGGANVKGSLVDITGHEVAKVRVKDNLNGTYSCHYVCPKPGQFVLHAMIGKTNIRDSPFHPIVKPGEPMPSMCIASGPGITKAVAGQTAEFFVHTKDSNGEDIKEGGARIFSVFSDGGKPLAVNVQDNQNGTYTCTYVPTNSGDSELTVKVQTENYGTGDVKNSPFRVAVQPGAPSAENTEASGVGVTLAVAGVEAPVIVTTKDKFGNKLKTGGAPVKATLTNLADRTSVPVEVLDNGDGTYHLGYTPNKAGPHEFLVTLGATPIRDMPSVVNVAPGRPSPLNFDLEGLELDANGRRVIVAGRTDKFHIISKDAFGNPLITGGLPIQGRMYGKEDVPVLAADLGTGAYEVSYTPYKVGDYTLDVRVANEPIGKKHPIPMVVIPGAADGSHSVANGPGLTKARVGEKNPFRVQVRDAFDNNVTMGGNAVGGELRPFDRALPVVPVTVVDNGDGTYDCSYPSVAKAGQYQLIPVVNGQPVKDSPFNLVVEPGLTSSDNTVVELPNRAVAGVDTIGVLLRDDQLNRQTRGGDKVKAHVLPLSPIEVTARDNGDGTYTVDYPPSLRGDVEVRVKVNGKVAPGGPYTIQVQDNPVVVEDQQRASQYLPTSGGLLARLLAEATESERRAIFAELERVSNRS